MRDKLVGFKTLLLLLIVVCTAPVFAQTEAKKSDKVEAPVPASTAAASTKQTPAVQPQAAPAAVAKPPDPKAPSKPAATPKPESAPAKASSPPPAAKKPAAKAPAVPKPSTTFDAELSGIANDITDTFFARLRAQRKAAPKEWYVRTSYTSTSQETISGGRTIDIKTTSRQLDAEYRRNNEEKYNFIAGAANIRTRDPANKVYPARTGYYFAYGGKGKRLGPKMEAGVGLGILRDYDNGSRTQPAIALNVRGQWPFSTRLLFDSQVLLIEPIDNGLKLDNEFSLQYCIIQGLYIRLGFTLTNMVHPQLNTGDWNQSSRLSLLYRRTK